MKKLYKAFLALITVGFLSAPTIAAPVELHYWHGHTENLKVNPNGNIIIKIDLIEKLGADSIIYGYDKSNNYICYRENGNTKMKSGEEITLEIEEGIYHLFDKETKKRLN